MSLLQADEGEDFEHDIVLPAGRIAGRVIGIDGEPAALTPVNCRATRQRRRSGVRTTFPGCPYYRLSLLQARACRRWMEEDAPALVQHTHRILEPFDREFGGWMGEVPETLVAVLGEAGRHYLPWVSVATVRGRAELKFASGQRVVIRATEFLKEARSVLLARYRELRSGALDAVLERAGIRRFFADHVAEAGTVPAWDTPPRPRLNRPFPPEHEGS